MSKKEDTPFVIDFKQRNGSNYGSASSQQTPTTSGNTNNNNNSLTQLRPLTPSSSRRFTLHGHGHHIEVRDHCHRKRTEGVDVKARKKLIIASVLCLIFMICEVIGGVLSNSLAIATDAAHLLTDFASFMISLFAIWIAGRPSTQRMSFGWYRAEVIGAMASVVMIWVITGILVYLAIQRIITGEFEVDAKIMLITSGLAILVNLIMGFQLQHGHSHGGGGHGHSHGGGGGNIAKTPKKQIKRQGLREEPAPTAGLTLAPSKHSITRSSDSVARPAVIDLDDMDSDSVPSHKSSQKSSKAVSMDTLKEVDDANAGTEGIGTPKSSKTVSIATIKSDGDGLPATGSEIIRTDVANKRLENGVAGLEARDSELPKESCQRSRSRSIHEVPSTVAGIMAEPPYEGVNINVRAAYIHVLGDMVQSVGVFIAALFIYFRPDWVIADPICTFVFSIIVLYTTFNIMRDALVVLMEGTPSYTNYTEVLQIFESIEGVERVHNLRIWALSINKVALSVHLAIAPGANPKKILQVATTAVHTRYNFFETTIQIEEYTTQMEDCNQCEIPRA